MPKTGKRLHVLKRPKLRQSWNKYNLYNLWRQRDPRVGTTDAETFFQQKWRAKGLLRAYHGEHIKERDWERMFSRRLLSVANMDPRYMAENDGSEKAAGRGSGKDSVPQWGESEIEPKAITPYMNMAFAPMERRLDIAIFRAMFASSARQARQFCVHGAVKVNGKKMPYPAYRLNPGDMFQVDVEKVLYAVGAPKVGASKPKESEDSADDAAPAETEAAPETAETLAPEAEDAAIEAEEAAAQDPDTTDKIEQPVDLKPSRAAIKSLIKQAKATLQEQKLNVQNKQALRAFIKQAKPLMSGGKDATPGSIAKELTKIMGDLKLTDPTADAAGEAAEDASETSAPKFTPEELRELEERIKEEEENPYDPSKPYATPWKPRPYLAPFAFIPQYLEVNHNICSAVYLRHPVARVGTAEVPTPFPYRVNQLAFNWYLRRR
ncbi:hypothetical protein JX265_000044 [Neoarthrinium moseri]|uniref:RNA-binding S4 domain-containing protein n=1 Tax=Neoarthrinium moseri TaxID=1658444 RepID=A0A9Q0ARW4_9PEZI|nr:uncharacterized protein JN550_001254 [Neoarthrinium moseri]KAI1845777.1 hypothetical protein JX266_008142 [Neoarthrinium moseri]KAI1877182.1 hypothetical protein JN550_001254 [Neoarthrinium moseri]KAI1881218.1 hypothetical protein JX265_000044 [Neoarthrinium moseri]